MRVLLLVRHGQASFGAEDYDALSALGHEQSKVLGRALATRGVRPDLVVRGGMRRHEETARGLLEGFGADLPVEVDDGWDEFDFQHVVEVHRPDYRSRPAMLADLARSREPRVAFQQVFEEATARWSGGSHDADYHEPFRAFGSRVDTALRRTAALAPDRGTVLVVSSGGPIGLAVSQLLAGDAALWPQLNRVAVNTAVTKVLHGRSGLTLATYNEHSHLEHDRSLVTYR
ncbi:MAG TPA: histidine phosphatase family protein [Marmoricola sp.]|jgi:broad specificity phosphatase PhoE|nr:histidine phosphatase family protein [Marmoricola sp.]